MSNLELKTYKNYKELCSVMGWCVSSGNTKKSQLKELDTYCNYHKEGNKFIIDEIFDIQKEKEDLRRNGNNSIYSEDIDKLIVHMCSELENGKYNYIELTTNGFLNKLHMTNKNYSVGRCNLDRFSRWAEIPIETLYDFFNSTYKKNKDILESGLKRLESKSLIMTTTVIKVCLLNNTHKNASDNEIESILEIEQEVLKKINVKDKQEAFLKGKWNLFQKEKSEMLRELMGFLYDYKAYHIITTKAFRQMLLNEREKEDCEFNLNYNIQDSAIISATKRHKKIYEKYKGDGNGFGIPFYDKEKNRLSKNYISDSTRVTRICIDMLDPIDLWNELENEDNNKYTYCESTRTDYQKEWELLNSEFDFDEMFS